MRVLYIDVDSLRPDHLGCYGYHRKTSPNIDSLAQEGVRFNNLYITDAPCLPSRTALWSGRYGFRTGVVNHGGAVSSPFNEGQSRGFRDSFGKTSWMTALRQAGMKTVTISSFGERHSAWHWYAGYNEIYNPGKRGLESADQVAPIALDWLDKNGAEDNWFLHVNLWDPHTPYRTPDEFGNPFADEPLPQWLTQDVWERAYAGYGPHSPQEVNGYGSENVSATWHKHLDNIESMTDVKTWIDGYDTGIRYADHWIGIIFDKLREIQIYDDVAIVISADHGENQGELNVWGDHQTADAITCRVPLIMRIPGITTTRVDDALYHHFDWAATLIELVGGNVPDNWDGISFAHALKDQQSAGRSYLITSQGAWSCQRGVRFNANDRQYLFLDTYHAGHKMIEPQMLFDLSSDPHEQVNLIDTQPELVSTALSYLHDWRTAMMHRSESSIDPLMTVLREGGAFHTRGELPNYLKRLRATGRGNHAALLAKRYPDEV